MAVDFTIKAGDTAPAIKATLTDATDVVVNLSGATVRFIMKDKATGTTAVDAAATVTSAVNGLVQYQWQTGDTDTPDSYNAEFEVLFGNGTYETFPNSRYIQVKVKDDLGGNV